MNQGTQGYSLTKKIEGRKSRETVPLKFHLCMEGNAFHESPFKPELIAVEWHP
jgi:hypothetical protein